MVSQWMYEMERSWSESLPLQQWLLVAASWVLLTNDLLLRSQHFFVQIGSKNCVEGVSGFMIMTVWCGVDV
jgi:hypothetical protein